MSLFDAFFPKAKPENLEKTLPKSGGFFSKISKAIIGKSSVDEETLDTIEEILISADVGLPTTMRIIDKIKARVSREKYTSTDELNALLKDEISSLVQSYKEERTMSKPYVLLVVGVNGVGKTTTIGKMTAQWMKQGKKVLLGAADTFRAAAVDQLKMWGQRTGATVVAGNPSADPSSVAYQAIEQGLKNEADVIIIDTAGRLHTKINLMDELSKIKRVMAKLIPDAPHDVMLVLDGSTGQNAFVQAREFTKATQVTCLTITKLDGTAKGGVLLGLSSEFTIPVRFIGVGEKMEDLQLFDARTFVDALFQSPA